MSTTSDKNRKTPQRHQPQRHDVIFESVVYVQPLTYVILYRYAISPTYATYFEYDTPLFYVGGGGALVSRFRWCRLRPLGPRAWVFSFGRLLTVRPLVGFALTVKAGGRASRYPVVLVGPRVPKGGTAARGTWWQLGCALRPSWREGRPWHASFWLEMSTASSIWRSRTWGSVLRPRRGRAPGRGGCFQICSETLPSRV